MTVAEMCAMALHCHRQEDLVRAESLYREVLETDRNQTAAWFGLGLLCQGKGQLAEAEQCYEQAVRLRPDFAEAHNNLGVILESQGRSQPAIACYRRAVYQKPAYADAWNNLGAALLTLGSSEEATACCRRAVELAPDFGPAHHRLGLALTAQGMLTEALASYRRAARLQPGDAQVHNDLGVALARLRKLDEAATCYREAIGLEPRFAQAHNNLGVILKDQGQLAEAAACFGEALRLNPTYAGAYNNLGNAHRDRGCCQEAADCYAAALRCRPDFPEAHNNLGALRALEGKWDQALACYEQALHLRPDYADAHWNRAIAWLIQGDFERGWPEFEWRWRQPQVGPPPFPAPFWDGTPLCGKTILLYAEQGLGDTFQFIRYAPLVKERGGQVVMACQRPLRHVLRRCPGVDRLVAEGDPVPGFDVHAPLMSLPGILGTTLATIPARVPYLSADSVLVEQWHRELSSFRGFRIGIAWQGDPRHPVDRWRSIPLEEFAPLSMLPGTHLFSLQKGPAVTQLGQLADRCRVIDLGSSLDESSGAFMDTAAAMMNLDLVVTSDTAIAHLAGALGVAVWVILGRVPDWRWLLDREHSPWYPTMRLFRQEQRGDWQGVLRRVAAEVRRLRTFRS